MDAKAKIQMQPGWLSLPPNLGENPPGRSQPIEPLIRLLAAKLDEADIAWCVLRNADGLPAYTRYDLDLLLAAEQLPVFENILKTCLAETGWQVLGRITKRHYQCIMLYLNMPEGDYFFLPLDVFTALEYRGLRLLDAGHVLSQRLRNGQGIWMLPTGMEAAITLLKEWVPHGKLKENSRESLRQDTARDPDSFRDTLSVAAGKELGAIIVELVQQGIWVLTPEQLRDLRRAIHDRTPTRWLAVADMLLQNIRHLFRPALGRVVSLAGADGSGKTTLAEGLFRSTYKRPFKACRYVHGHVGVLPRFRDMRAALRRLFGLPAHPPTAEPDMLKGMMEPLPAWKSVALAGYYALDLCLARLLIRRWRSQWALVIMDRSFFDYFYQLGHRRCPQWVLRALLFMIPKPDLLLCLADDPEHIYARKPELTVAEIICEQEILATLVERYPFARCLDGRAGIESIVTAGQHEIWATLGLGQRLSWRQWSVGSRPILAYEAGAANSHWRALTLYSRSTPKRVWLIRAIQWAARCGLDRWLAPERCEVAELLSAGELETLLAELRALFSVESLEWLLTWPARVERRRIYVQFQVPGGGAGVIKIGAGEFNLKQLFNEAEMLRQLTGHEHPFGIPAVLFAKLWSNGRTILALSNFPNPGAFLSKAEIEQWGHIVLRHLESLSIPDFAHGDLGPGNMLLDAQGKLFLFDWENASADAPQGTDAAGLWLSQRQREVLRQPEQAVRELHEYMQGWGDVDCSAVLDFLVARENLAAQRLREVWP
ncbi:MAG: hypothetical protein GX803_07660 [Lentisphaerae bacterium]|jgi:hypothetical protein|nr:hypothetical protein [Lentisphaerota bacterium]